MAADWAELQRDMLELIVKKINLLEDVVRFGVVCRSWSDIGTSNKNNLLSPQIPCLMLPDKPRGSDYRQIYSLSKEDIVIKNLYIPEMSDRKCIGLHYGWVLTVTLKRGEVNLIRPLSRAQIELPPQPSLEGYPNCSRPPSYTIIRSAALSGSGASIGLGSRGFDCIYNVTYYQDRFYSASFKSDVWGYKVDHDDDSIVAYKINTTKCQAERNCWPYIVGSTRGLLLITRKDVFQDDLHDHQGWYPSKQELDDYEENPEEELKENNSTRSRSWLDKFSVFEFDLITGEYKQTKSLGDRAIFVGHNTSISMDCASEFTGIKSNHIYFTDDRVEHYLNLLRGGGTDMGSYSLKDEQGTPFKIQESSTRSKICPPFWFIPSL